MNLRNWRVWFSVGALLLSLIALWCSYKAYENAMESYKNSLKSYVEAIETLERVGGKPPRVAPETPGTVELRIFGTTSDSWLGKIILVHIHSGSGLQTIKCSVVRTNIKTRGPEGFNSFWCSAWIPKGSYSVSITTQKGELVSKKGGSTWWPWDTPFYGGRNCGFSLK